MDNISNSILFMVVSFALAIVIIWKKESIPERIRRPIAIIALFMVCAAFIMMIVSLFQIN